MTVAALPNYKTFVGAGTTGPFTFAFTFDSNTEISCKVLVAGQLNLLSPAFDYTVTGAGSSTGGSVTLTTALAVGAVLTVTRTLALAQDTNLPSQGPFFSTTVEYTFDRIVKMVQQLYTINSSTFITAVTSPSTTTFVEANASAGAGGAGIDGGIIGVTVQYSGSGLLTVTKNDNTQYLVAVLPPAGWTICGRTEYDLSVGGESASFYPGLYSNLVKV